MKYLAVVGSYLYNVIEGACTEEFIDSVMRDVEENEEAVKFIEITEEEWDDYENWIKDRTLPIHNNIINRQKYSPKKMTGWRLEH